MGTQGAQALAVAIYFGLRDLVNLFLSHPGIDVNGTLPLSMDYLPLGWRTAPDSIAALDYIGYLREDRDAHSTSLLLAVDNDDLGVVNQIMNHPTFDPARSRLRLAPFQAVKKRAERVFPVLLGGDLTQRNDEGDCLLAVVLAFGSDCFYRVFQQQAVFDPLTQNLPSCITAAAHLMSVAEFEFLARFQAIDMNLPVTHSANRFPDLPPLLCRSRRIRHSHIEGIRVSARASEGVPPIFSLNPGDIAASTVLINPRIDLNQRGKHNETILFNLLLDGGHIGGIEEVGRLDLNAVDRHGNTAIGCSAVSQWGVWTEPIIGLPWDFSITNENRDTALELTNCRSRRFSTDATAAEADIPATPPGKIVLLR
jgi:hypothetical protein